MNEITTRAGFAAFIGAPNAGKSTLLNQLLGEKLSIVTHKAQTTRIRVLGLLTEKDAQIGMIDTPGLFQPRTRLEKTMVQAAWDSLDGADAVLLLVDAAARQPDAKTDSIIEALAQRGQKATLVLNKVDKIKQGKLLPIAENLQASGIFDKIFMISALTGDGVEDLREHLYQAMPKGPWPYPEDQLTDLPERLLAAEITREKMLELLHDELPYGATVMPEAWEQKKDGSIVVRQQILVERINHRGMVLGKQGSKIKEIGSGARADMIEQFGCKVHLFLNVKVDEKWQDKPDYYKLFGLT